MNGYFENTMQLTRFMLRRERVTSTAWIVMLILVVVGLVPGMYAALDATARNEMLGVLANPAMVAMAGPAYAEIHGTFGAFYTNLMFIFTAFTVAIMNIFLVVRHTRADEERGRYEVLRSLPMGRLAGINAAMITAVIINAALAVLMGIFMYLGGLIGYTDMSFSASMLWGVALGATGLFFAALTALFCQLSAITRSVMAYSFVALIFLYLLRAPGDMNPDMEWLALISPLGLVMRTQVFGYDYWWPVWVLLIGAAAITALAYRLNATRDIDQGLIPARPGKAYGGWLLSSAPGLTFRLQRFMVILVVVGMFLLGASYGSVLGEVESFVASNEMYQTLILSPAGIDISVLYGIPVEDAITIMNQLLGAAGFTVVEMFAGFIGGMMALMGLAALIVFTLKAKSEEKDIRTELVLAASVSRTKYLLGFVAIAFVAAVLLQAAMGLGLYVMAVNTLANPADISLGFVMQTSLVYVPALWVMIGVAVLLLGAWPKGTGIVWGYFAYAFFMDLIGSFGIFPEWLGYTTPFGYVPQLPMEDINFVTMGLMTAVAVGLTVLGIFFYNRRDINAVTHSGVSIKPTKILTRPRI
ncbi:MAG: hypothetical protein FWC92_08970 [Defluviitaleaceae bacterium]|nr:hypothetical protein [Defluviitaleaceae bacterium]